MYSIEYMPIFMPATKFLFITHVLLTTFIISTLLIELVYG
jgi:hypothetical protein